MALPPLGYRACVEPYAQQRQVVAEVLGGLAWETLAVLVGLVVLLALSGPALAAGLFRRLAPPAVEVARRVREGPAGEAFSHRFPGVVAWFRRDHSFTRSLGLYLVVGAALFLGCLNLFWGVVEAVHWSPEVQAFDQSLAVSYRERVSAEEFAFFRSVTVLAGATATAVLGVAVGVALLLLRRRDLFVVWTVGVLGNSLLNLALKSAFQRGRPTVEDPFLLEHFYSFPSGHAMASVVLCGLLAYVLSVLLPSAVSRAFILLTLILGLAVGMSRMVLGVHYFSDVVAGWAVGLGWLAVVIVGAEFRRRGAAGSHPPEP